MSISIRFYLQADWEKIISFIFIRWIDRKIVEKNVIITGIAETANPSRHFAFHLAEITYRPTVHLTLSGLPEILNCPTNSYSKINNN